jgi:hypothetical protein
MFCISLYSCCLSVSFVLNLDDEELEFLEFENHLGYPGGKHKHESRW